MSMAIHGSLHKKFWYFQLFIQDYAYFFLFQYVYTKLRQYYLFTFGFFFQIFV